MVSWSDVTLKAGGVLNAQVVKTSGKYVIKKSRKIQINEEGHQFYFTLELDISFEPLDDKSSSLNKAEVFLLPDEFVSFAIGLHRYQFPLPSEFHYRLVENPQIVCIYIESKEPPEHFAERLAAALKAIDCL